MQKDQSKFDNGIWLTPRSSEPDTPSDGMMYYDITLDKFRGFQNGVWVDFGLGITSITVDDVTIEAPGGTLQVKDGGISYAKLAADVTKHLVPIGAVVAYSGPLSGPLFTQDVWAPCIGQGISRTTYADLFALIGVTHGQGDGSTTFNVPDYRGRFLRGVNIGTGRDPNAGARTAMATGGNAGDQVGSIQGSATQTHSHAISDPGHNHPITVAGLGFQLGNVGPDDGTKFSFGDNLLRGADVITTSRTTGIVVQNFTGSSETRPINAYCQWLIKVR